MPNFLSRGAQSLLRAFFKRVPENRLGYGINGHKQIMEHEFFSSIDWQKLYRREIKPPFKPILNSDLTSQFDSKFTKQAPSGKPNLFPTQHLYFQTPWPNRHLLMHSFADLASTGMIKQFFRKVELTF